MAKSEAKPAAEARAEAGGEGPAELYHAAIVEAARRACGSGRLDNPDASVSVDNPLCGDRVSIDVHVAGGRLRGVAHRVRGCLLCEAAASIIATNAIGETAQELALVSAALSDAHWPMHWPMASPMAASAGRTWRYLLRLPVTAAGIAA